MDVLHDTRSFRSASSNFAFRPYHHRRWTACPGWKRKPASDYSGNNGDGGGSRNGIQRRFPVSQTEGGPSRFHQQSSVKRSRPQNSAHQNDSIASGSDRAVSGGRENLHLGVIVTLARQQWSAKAPHYSKERNNGKHVLAPRGRRTAQIVMAVLYSWV